MDDFYDTALEVAKTYDVETKPDSLVLYSISFLPTKENKLKAFEYVKSSVQVADIEKLSEWGIVNNITQ